MSERQGPKSRDKTTNWAAYNAALKTRGSLTIWFDKDMQWYAPVSGKRGRQQTFTDAAIQFCLSIKRLGERVMACTFERQVTELQVRVALLNRFTRLGCPTILCQIDSDGDNGRHGLPLPTIE